MWQWLCRCPHSHHQLTPMHACMRHGHGPVCPHALARGLALVDCVGTLLQGLPLVDGGRTVLQGLALVDGVGGTLLDGVALAGGAGTELQGLAFLGRFSGTVLQGLAHVDAPAGEYCRDQLLWTALQDCTARTSSSGRYCGTVQCTSGRSTAFTLITKQRNNITCSEHASPVSASARPSGALASNNDCKVSTPTLLPFCKYSIHSLNFWIHGNICSTALWEQMAYLGFIRTDTSHGLFFSSKARRV